jgi:hypothetical protein
VTIFVNSPPLIYLAAIGRFDLLRSLYSHTLSLHPCTKRWWTRAPGSRAVAASDPAAGRTSQLQQERSRLREVRPNDRRRRPVAGSIGDKLRHRDRVSLGVVAVIAVTHAEVELPRVVQAGLQHGWCVPSRSLE